MRYCTVENCKNKHFGLGFCYNHYKKQWHKSNTDALTNKPEYRSWDAMIQRCHNPKNRHYYNYGGRGITVCDEWRNDSNAFYNYVGNRPSPKYSIDRIDNNGNYEPGNVRWADKYQQNDNTRKPSKYGCRGIEYRDRKMGRRWTASISVNNKKVALGTFDTLDEAIKARRDAEIEL